MKVQTYEGLGGFSGPAVRLYVTTQGERVLFNQLESFIKKRGVVVNFKSDNSGLDHVGPGLLEISSDNNKKDEGEDFVPVTWKVVQYSYTCLCGKHSLAICCKSGSGDGPGPVLPNNLINLCCADKKAILTHKRELRNPTLEQVAEAYS